MRSSRFVEMLVGLFVILGVAAIFVLTMRVSNLSATPGMSQGYTVSAHFRNVGGLKVGSAVTMAGVDIGRVISIAIDPYTYDAIVKLRISDGYRNIPDDSDAKILTAGLLGEQYVGINAGGSLTYLKAGSEIQFTQSALVLEEIIGKFMVNMSQNSGSQASTK